MDIHQYLHAISCHRTIYKKLMIPYGQTKKIKRIGSNEDGLQVKLVNFGYRFERIRLFSEVSKSFVTEKKSGLHWRKLLKYHDSVVILVSEEVLSKEIVLSSFEMFFFSLLLTSVSLCIESICWQKTETFCWILFSNFGRKN